MTVVREGQVFSCLLLSSCEAASFPIIGTLAMASGGPLQALDIVCTSSYHLRSQLGCRLCHLLSFSTPYLISMGFPVIYPTT